MSLCAGSLVSSAVKQATFQSTQPVSTGATGVAGVSDEDEALNKVIADSLLEWPAAEAAAAEAAGIDLVGDSGAGPSSGLAQPAPMSDDAYQRQIEQAMQQSLHEQTGAQQFMPESAEIDSAVAPDAAPSAAGLSGTEEACNLWWCR
jgi:hypothetical protein